MKERDSRLSMGARFDEGYQCVRLELRSRVRFAGEAPKRMD